MFPVKPDKFRRLISKSCTFLIDLSFTERTLKYCSPSILLNFAVNTSGCLGIKSATNEKMTNESMKLNIGPANVTNIFSGAGRFAKTYFFSDSDSFL